MMLSGSLNGTKKPAIMLLMSLRKRYYVECIYRGSGGKDSMKDSRRGVVAGASVADSGMKAGGLVSPI